MYQVDSIPYSPRLPHERYSVYSSYDQIHPSLFYTLSLSDSSDSHLRSSSSTSSSMSSPRSHHDPLDMPSAPASLSRSRSKLAHLHLASSQSSSVPIYDSIDGEFDWNVTFASLVDHMKLWASNEDNSNTTDEDSIQMLRNMISLYDDFVHTAEVYGKIIIDEMNLPPTKKTILPTNMGGLAGGDKYIMHNIMFKFAIDSNNLFDGDDEAATKMAANDLRGLMSCAQASIFGLNFPMSALIDYRGQRLVALTLLPISRHTLQYGSADGGRTVKAFNPELNEMMQKLGAALNLRPHQVKPTPTSAPCVMHTAADVEGHLGNDGRYYLCDFGRMFPPEFPLEQTERTRYSHLYKLFRPEFVIKHPTPLCSDALSGFIYFTDGLKEYNEEIKIATNYLRGTVIPSCAALVDSLNPCYFEFHFSEILHREGVNMRYLRQVAVHCNSEYSKMLLITEAIARTMKSLLRLDLRSVNKKQYTSRSSFEKAVVQNLNLFFGSSKESSECWNTVIKQELLSHFPVIAPIEGATEFPYYKNVDDLPDDLKAYCLNFKVDRSPSGSAMSRVLNLVLAMSKIALNPRVKITPCFFRKSKPLDEADCLNTEARIKSMNFIIRLNAMYYHTIGISKLKLAKEKGEFIRRLEKATMEETQKQILIADARHAQADLEEAGASYLQRGVEYCAAALRTAPFDVFCIVLFVLNQAILGVHECALEKARLVQNLLGPSYLSLGLLNKIKFNMKNAATVLKPESRDVVAEMARRSPAFSAMAEECERIIGIELAEGIVQ